MLSRKNQVTKKVYKVSIFPEPYELMIEAVDRISAKQIAIKKLGIDMKDIFDITATTQYFRMTNSFGKSNENGKTCANDKMFLRKMKREKYI